MSEQEKCSGCGGGKSNIGLTSLIKGMIYGECSGSDKKSRMDICRACKAVDSRGDRLFREIDGQVFCGVPRPGARNGVPSLDEIKNVIRDETVDGCGCDLEYKTSRAEAECPLKKWGVSASKESKKGKKVLFRIQKASSPDFWINMHAVAGYRAKHPDAYISLGINDTSALGWVSSFSEANEIVDFSESKDPYDLVIDLEDLQAESGSKHLAACSFDDAVSPVTPVINIQNSDLEWASTQPDIDVLVFPLNMSRMEIHQWPTNRWVLLEEELLNKGVKVSSLDISMSGNKTKMLRSMRYLNEQGGHIYSLIRKAKLVLSADVSMTHVAAILGTKAVFLQGPDDFEAEFSFYGDRVIAARSSMNCVGCGFKEIKGYNRSCLYGCEALGRLFSESISSKVISVLEEIDGS